MDLDARLTRGLFLAGTVPFPTPFPTIGPISLDVGHLTQTLGAGAVEKKIVVSQQRQCDSTIVRVMLREDVSALFISGVRDSGGAFHISDKPQADSLEQGEWFFGADIDVVKIRARLNLQEGVNIVSRDSVLRGIVYIAEDRPILSIKEVALTAGAEIERYGCSPCFAPLTARRGDPWLIPMCSPCYFSAYHSLEVSQRALDWNEVTGWGCSPCPCPPCCPER